LNPHKGILARYSENQPKQGAPQLIKEQGIRLNHWEPSQTIPSLATGWTPHTATKKTPKTETIITETGEEFNKYPLISINNQPNQIDLKGTEKLPNYYHQQ
jgi:hypothetical protein